ncbi:P-loop containing nucleoside triphosphate hydrolase protein [Schizopora paradoxa]|uniref:DNA 3'-5' helicase n=1 Tax=Schizopora paradoxa TaxID=27342 RepID=A0A0H2RHN3_9AGAM|nr:P-loop containing nucleoside triphosphate hydrolase protein [Schizopora paradoxa]
MQNFFLSSLFPPSTTLTMARQPTASLHSQHRKVQCRRVLPSSFRDPTKNPETSRDSEPRRLNEEELAEVKKAMEAHFQDGRMPRDFQIDMVVAQEESRDAMCHAATGLGKTFIAAAPFLLERNKTRVTIMVSPLVALQNEMVETFKKEYGVTAIAINSSHGGCTYKVMKDIASGMYNIVLLSPEMLLTERFIRNVLRNKEFSARVYSVFIDEAHCISHWGESFRKQYGRLGMIRAFLPKGTPVTAVSASLTPRVARDVRGSLQFRDGYLFVNKGNNRSNVSLVVRSIHNKADSYTDLDFLIPDGTTQRLAIKKAWVYCDHIHDGSDIVDHLQDRLPPELHDAIRPYHATLEPDYREKCMRLFREGHIRVLICTDAAGMGCNVPDVDIVVQWKLTGKLSSFIQRAGRAARGPDRTGIAVLLAEPSAYTLDTSPPDEPAFDVNEASQDGATSQSGKKTKSKKTAKSKTSQAKKSRPQKPRLSKEVAEQHGRWRGQRDGKGDSVPSLSGAAVTTSPPEVHIQEDTEGTHALVQTSTCRRTVISSVFGNPTPVVTVPCCDICDPTLLDLTRPGKAKKTPRNPKAPEINPDPHIALSLRNWRSRIYERDYPGAFFGASSLLPDDAIDIIASLPLFTNKLIEAHLQNKWRYWTRYGEDLVQCVLHAVEESEGALVVSEGVHGDLESGPQIGQEPEPRTCEASDDRNIAQLNVSASASGARSSRSRQTELSKNPRPAKRRRANKRAQGDAIEGASVFELDTTTAESNATAHASGNVGRAGSEGQPAIQSAAAIPPIPNTVELVPMSYRVPVSHTQSFGYYSSYIPYDRPP